ncbi:MAG: DsbA family protein [Chloroflexi bacterium]|nr:DsbA family protein [Chloroflexota bacterium]
MSRRRRPRRIPTAGTSRRSRHERDGGRSALATVRPWILPSVFGAAALAAIFILVGAISSAPAAGPRLAPPVLGDAAAPVVIQEYGDFQCPSCGAFFRAIEPQVRDAYITPGRARLEWHDFAWIGQESRDAANAARCAQVQGGFWEYHDLLYARQVGENSGAFAKVRLKGFGQELGLDAAAFDACVDGGTYAAAVQADFAEVRSRGFTGTPTFIIGARRIVGAQPFEVFAAAIEAELAGR